MTFYDPYSAYRKGGGVVNSTPLNNSPINIGNVGYSGGTSSLYYNPYMNNNMGSYYTGNYNNFYNPYSGSSYLEEMRKQQEEAQTAESKMWQMCTMLNGLYYGKSEEEISKDKLNYDRDFIAEEHRKEREKRRKILERLQKEEDEAKIVFVDEEENLSAKEKQEKELDNSGFFSMNQMSYVSNNNFNRDYLIRLLMQGREVIYGFNNKFIEELETSKEKYKNMSMTEYFNNEAGYIYYLNVMEEEAYKQKAKELQNRYNRRDFRNNLLRGTTNIPMYNSLSNNYFKQPVDKSDLEIKLPTELNNDYARRKKMFIDRIMANAKRVGTDITLGGNIDINEVYNND